MSDEKRSEHLDDTMPRVVADAIVHLPPAPDATDRDVARVMRAVRAHTAIARRRRFATIGLAIAASWLGVWVLSDRSPAPADPTAGLSTRPAVRFEIVAPEVQSVALVGDFNGWNPRATPMTRDPQTGAWAASVPLNEGRYLYAFVADGARWMPDPNAPLAAADDFSRQNSVLVVGTHTTVAPQ